MWGNVSVWRRREKGESVPLQVEQIKLWRCWSSRRHAGEFEVEWRRKGGGNWERGEKSADERNEFVRRQLEKREKGWKQNGEEQKKMN